MSYIFLRLLRYGMSRSVNCLYEHLTAFPDSDIWICSPLIARYGGSSIIFFAVYLEARNIALDFEVFFFMSLSSHQSEKLSRSAFKKTVTILR